VYSKVRASIKFDAPRQRLELRERGAEILHRRLQRAPVPFFDRERVRRELRAPLDQRSRLLGEFSGSKTNSRSTLATTARASTKKVRASTARPSASRLACVGTRSPSSTSPRAPVSRSGTLSAAIASLDRGGSGGCIAPFLREARAASAFPLPLNRAAVGLE
jgi:hypothetical protein